VRHVSSDGTRKSSQPVRFTFCETPVRQRPGSTAGCRQDLRDLVVHRCDGPLVEMEVRVDDPCQGLRHTQLDAAGMKHTRSRSTPALILERRDLDGPSGLGERELARQVHGAWPTRHDFDPRTSPPSLQLGADHGRGRDQRDDSHGTARRAHIAHPAGQWVPSGTNLGHHLQATGSEGPRSTTQTVDRTDAPSSGSAFAPATSFRNARPRLLRSALSSSDGWWRYALTTWLWDVNVLQDLVGQLGGVEQWRVDRSAASLKPSPCAARNKSNRSATRSAPIHRASQRCDGGPATASLLTLIGTRRSSPRRCPPRCERRRRACHRGRCRRTECACS